MAEDRAGAFGGKRSWPLQVTAGAANPATHPDNTAELRSTPSALLRVFGFMRRAHPRSRQVGCAGMARPGPDFCRELVRLVGRVAGFAYRIPISIFCEGSNTISCRPVHLCNGKNNFVEGGPVARFSCIVGIREFRVGPKNYPTRRRLDCMVHGTWCFRPRGLRDSSSGSQDDTTVLPANLTPVFGADGQVS